MSSDDVSRIEMLLREHFARTEKQLSDILVVIAMPQIVGGVKSLFGAIIDGVSALAGVFRKDNKA